jgi:HlyD family secretion protein
VKVKVATPKQQPLSWMIEQPGRIEAFEVTPVVAKIPGHVKSLAPDAAAVKAGVKLPGGQLPVIDIGSFVEAGQLLATLDVPELAQELAAKKAAVARADAERVQAEKELAVADAQVTAAELMVKEAEAGVTKAETEVVRWKAELDQVNTQITGGVADVQTRTVITKNWEAAKAGKVEAEAKVATAGALVKERMARKGRAEADVTAAGAKRNESEAEARRVEALTGYTQITAPFTGIVTARNVHTRHLTPPTDPSLPREMFTVARIDVLRVFVEVPESAAQNAGAGAEAVVRVPSLGGREFNGTVTRTTRVVSPGSHTLRIEIDLDNPDRVLVPGAYAVVQIKATASDALIIPGACVLAADETYSVFVIENGKAVKYRVQLGRSDGGIIQVTGKRKATLTAGPWAKFTGTEQVVSGNLGALADGTAVTLD